MTRSQIMTLGVTVVLFCGCAAPSGKTRASPPVPNVREETTPEADSNTRQPVIPASEADPALRPDLTFNSLQQAIAYYDARGFGVHGRFINSTWPAHFVSEKESAGELRFRLKTGATHVYPPAWGVPMKAVFLEDAAGKETVLVLRPNGKHPIEEKGSGELR